MFNWTVMVYMGGDNSLHGCVIPDINDMEAGAPTVTDSFRVVIQADKGEHVTTEEPWEGALRCPVWRPAKVVSGKISTPESEREYLGDVDMADPVNLKDFVEWAVLKYPAKRYMLILWSHGSGVDDTTAKAQSYAAVMQDRLRSKGIDQQVSQFMWSTQGLFLSYKRPHKLNKAIIQDTKGSLSNYTLSRVLKEIAELMPRKKIDILGFDACSMGGIEIACQVRNAAKIMIGSENFIPGDGWPYQDILRDVGDGVWADISDKHIEALAQKVVTKYGDCYRMDLNYSDAYTLSAVRLQSTEKIIGLVDRLAKLFINPLCGQERGKYLTEVERIRNEIETFDAPEFIDLGHFARSISSSGVFSNAIRETARSLADLIVSRSIDSPIVAETHSQEKTGHVNATGLTVFFPSFEDPKIYRGYSSLEFVKWSWDEFIKACFDVSPRFNIQVESKPKAKEMIATSGSDITITIKPINEEELSLNPSEITVMLAVDDYNLKFVTISPEKGVTLTYDLSSKRYFPNATFTIHFTNDAPPITYLFTVGLSNKGRTIDLDEKYSMVPIKVKAK